MSRGGGNAWGGGCTSECVLVTLGVVGVARCTCGGECARVMCALVLVCALVPVGTLGAQDFGSRSGRRFVRVRLMVFMEEILPLEGDVQIRPKEPTNIPSLPAAEAIHAPQSVCTKDDAPANICFMLVTLDTSHVERSPLNDDAESNMPTMSVTPDTSHLDMSLFNDDAE